MWVSRGRGCIYGNCLAQYCHEQETGNRWDLMTSGYKMLSNLLNLSEPIHIPLLYKDVSHGHSHSWGKLGRKVCDPLSSQLRIWQAKWTVSVLEPWLVLNSFIYLELAATGTCLSSYPVRSWEQWFLTSESWPLWGLNDPFKTIKKQLSTLGFLKGAK